MRQRLHDDLLRPAELFRRWDSDADGVVSLDELMAGVQKMGLGPDPEDEPELLEAIQGEVQAATGNTDGAIDFAMFASWLDPHSTYRRKVGIHYLSYILLATCYLLHATCRLLLTTYYLLPTRYSLLFATHCLLLTH